MELGRLLDLPPDCKGAIICAPHLTPVSLVRMLSALGATCRRFHSEVNEITDWARLWAQWALASPPPGGARDPLCAEIARWMHYARRLELPSVEQAVACVVRSATAHSYYKHLDIGRSALFSFNLSLVAGMRQARDGHYVEYVRGDGTEFHYTWTPTAQYRERFGQLAYDDGAPRAPQIVPGSGSTGVTYPEEHARHSRMRAELAAPDGTSDDPPLLLPPYVAADARTLCSAAVHGDGRHHGYYDVVAHKLTAEPRAALEGVVTEGAVCAASLQRRHLSSQVVLPTHALDALEAAERWAAPIEAALFALRVALAPDVFVGGGTPEGYAGLVRAPVIEKKSRFASASSRRNEPLVLVSTRLVCERILCPPRADEAAAAADGAPTAGASGAPPLGLSAFEAAARDLRAALLGFSADCFRHFAHAGARMALLRATLPCLLCEGPWRPKKLGLDADGQPRLADSVGDDLDGAPSPAQLRHAAIAEVVERAVERWEMLEAVARLVGHVREAKGERAGSMDLAAVGNDAQLFCKLVGINEDDMMH